MLEIPWERTFSLAERKVKYEYTDVEINGIAGFKDAQVKIIFN